MIQTGLNVIYRIIYCSCNRLVGTSHEVGAAIQDILSSSERNNEAESITGALLFNERVFAQVLEGPRKAVERLYASICSDPRHDQIVLLEADYAGRREFENWTMAFAETAVVNDPSRWLSSVRAQADPGEAARELLALLKVVLAARS